MATTAIPTGPASAVTAPETTPDVDRTVALTNRCAESKSPYVRSHETNATAWQLWTPETLALARRSNRLLFVSIGYSACHWCHVMARESFADTHIAQVLNENFIPVKVDREERPDIDRQYMDFLQATVGSGGWPLNVFVTPDLEPIFGGTYWPKAEFQDVVSKVAQAWKEQEARCRASAQQITKQLREFAQEGMLGGAADGLPADQDLNVPTSSGLELDLLDDAFRHYRNRYDSKYGGFGSAPKFPTPVHLRPLLRVGCYPKVVREIVGESVAAEAREMAIHTLERMARGGIKDQIGHGFARYSVTRDWSLPHFEKMLYDNAQLLPLYLDAYLVTRTPLFLETALDIASYLTSPPMVSSLGAIHASEDADSAESADATGPKREGAFYVWTAAELEKILSPDEYAVCSAYWGVRPEGNVDPRFDSQGELAGQNTLCVQCSDFAALGSVTGQSAEVAEQLVKSGAAKLAAYREAHRPRPALDDKIVTSWNGLAVTGLARTSAALRSSHPTESAALLAAAVRAVECIEKHLYDPTTATLRRVYRDGPGDGPGFADDYAFLIAGLLDLYEASFDARWLALADSLQQTQTRLFWDPARSGFFSTPANQADILVRAKDAMDNAEPSVNGVSAANLFRLGSLLSDVNYTRSATRTVACFEVEMAHHPGLMSGMLSSVVAADMGMKSLLIVGDETDEAVAVALRIARENVRPNCTVLRVPGPASGAADANAVNDESAKWLRERNPTLKELDAAKPMVQLCEQGVCRLLGKKEVETLFEE